MKGQVLHASHDKDITETEREKLQALEEKEGCLMSCHNFFA